MAGDSTEKGVMDAALEKKEATMGVYEVTLMCYMTLVTSDCLVFLSLHFPKMKILFRMLKF